MATARGADVDSDLFEVLGVPWGTDGPELRAAYRRAARQAHPDTGGSHEAMVRVQHAWQILSDPDRRRAYMTSYEYTHRPPPTGSAYSWDRSGHRGSGASSAGPAGGTRGRGTSGDRQGSRERRSGSSTSSRGARHDQGSTGGRTGPSEGRSGRDGAGSGWGGSQRAGWSSSEPGGGSRMGSRWRCSADDGSSPFGCHQNRLIGSRFCWDHATEAERTAARAASVHESGSLLPSSSTWRHGHSSGRRCGRW